MELSVLKDLIASLSDVTLFKENQNGTGFVASFVNGYTVSVQWGPGNYSDGSTTAEIAAWNTETSVWLQLGEYDDVIGWCTPEEIWEQIQRIKKI